MILKNIKVISVTGREWLTRGSLRYSVNVCFHSHDLNTKEKLCKSCLKNDMNMNICFPRDLGFYFVLVNTMSNIAET